MEVFPLSCKITGWSVEQLHDLALDYIIDTVSFLASEETLLNFAWSYEQYLQLLSQMNSPFRKEQARKHFHEVVGLVR